MSSGTLFLVNMIGLEEVFQYHRYYLQFNASGDGGLEEIPEANRVVLEYSFEFQMLY